MLLPSGHCWCVGSGEVWGQPRHSEAGGGCSAAERHPGHPSGRSTVGDDPARTETLNTMIYILEIKSEKVRSSTLGYFSHILDFGMRVAIFVKYLFFNDKLTMLINKVLIQKCVFCDV